MSNVYLLLHRESLHHAAVGGAVAALYVVAVTLPWTHRSLFIDVSQLICDHSKAMVINAKPRACNQACNFLVCAACHSGLDICLSFVVLNHQGRCWDEGRRCLPSRESRWMCRPYMEAGSVICASSQPQMLHWWPSMLRDAKWEGSVKA